MVNLYPFSATAAKPGVSAEELIENIDIGGTGHGAVGGEELPERGAWSPMPADYAADLPAELRGKRELVSLPRGWRLARKAYARTARYDGEIATELERLTADDAVKMVTLEKLPERIHIALERRQSMGCGEDPHQAAGTKNRIYLYKIPEKVIEGL